MQRNENITCKLKVFSIVVEICYSVVSDMLADKKVVDERIKTFVTECFSEKAEGFYEKILNLWVSEIDALVGHDAIVKEAF